MPDAGDRGPATVRRGRLLLDRGGAAARADDPRTARAAETRALDATARANNPRTDAYSAGRHMRFSWNTKSRGEAIRDSLAAIDTVETLRALQDDANSSAALFSAWTLDYYWLSGRLLQDGRRRGRPLAFSITERMRARSLLDVLDRSRPVTRSAAPRRSGSSGQLLEAIAAVQRSLMDPTLDEERRRAALRELEGLERREQEAQRQMALAFHDRARAPPAFATPRRPCSPRSPQTKPCCRSRSGCGRPTKATTAAGRG